MFQLTEKELKKLTSLDTPSKIQDYLDSIPFNFEESGETCMSPRRVLREKKANCIEGALLAGAALLLQNKRPLVLNLKVTKEDDDHLVTLFKENGYWGAISKTNHAVLRYRDPVYVSIRELAMSYFHEYFLIRTGEKTMTGFSRPINLKRFGTSWITEEDDLWAIAEYIYDSKHQATVPLANKKLLRKATKLECASAAISETTRS